MDVPCFSPGRGGRLKPLKDVLPFQVILWKHIDEHCMTLMNKHLLSKNLKGMEFLL
jgi:hypothetical protein